MTELDLILEAISLSHENFNPPMDKNQWTILQLSTLLDNIILDSDLFPEKMELRQYYLNFSDTLRLL